MFVDQVRAITIKLLVLFQECRKNEILLSKLKAKGSRA